MRCQLVLTGPLFAALVALALTAPLNAGESSSPASETLAERGYRLLTTKPYLPADFDQEVFDDLWKTWEEPLRSQAAAGSSDERRKLTFDRYGLTDAPGRTGGVAWQYVDDGHGGWVMNCLACHGGKVAGRVTPGVPNSLYDLQTLIEDVRATKLRLKKKLGHMDKGSLAMPLSGSIGTTNAVMFGKVLLAYRDAELNVHRDWPAPKMVHHDGDAPAWWHMQRKTRIYSDDFAPKGHRALMQFLLIPANGPKEFRAWEDDYRAILAWIESLKPPRYPWAVDQTLVAQGETVFRRVCADCHGTYGAGSRYPEKVIELDVIGTDPVRHGSLGAEGRRVYSQSWFVGGTSVPTVVEPVGYLAPPLDGVWASAPYLHNGSVPTLWHLLHTDARPLVWKRTPDGYDRERVGLEVATYDRFPDGVRSASQRRQIFDTRMFGKSSAGHSFPDELSEAEKRAVLEYLKTL